MKKFYLGLRIFFGALLLADIVYWYMQHSNGQKSSLNGDLAIFNIGLFLVSMLLFSFMLRTKVKK